MLITSIRFVALAIAGATVLACNKPLPPAVPPPSPVLTAEAPPPPPPPPAPPAPVPPPADPTEDELFDRMTLDALNATQPLGDAFFRYDDATLSAEARSSLQKNAEWLRRWPSTRIRIEGHCDARGTSEYNLALGERRANAARTYLVSLGISEERVSTVSLGEEAPVCLSENEQCWRQNRRAHHVVVAK